MAATESDVKRQLELEQERLRFLTLTEGADTTPAGGRFAFGANRGVAQFFGAPVDFVNALGSLAGIDRERPIGGSKFIEGQFEKVGAAAPGAELGFAGDVGQVTSFSLFSALGTLAAGTRSLAAATQAPLQTTPKLTTSLVQDIARTAQRNPVSFWAFESASAVGAGAGRGVAREMFPESEGAQAFAELLGGFSPFAAIQTAKFAGRSVIPLMEKMPVTGFAVRSVRRAINQIKPTSAAGRAKARAERATATPETSVARTAREDIIPDSGLTPAQRAADPGLLELEKSVMTANEELERVYLSRFATVNRAIRESLDEPRSLTGFRVVEGENVPLHKTREYLSGLMDTRIEQAAAKVEQEMVKLGPRATREDFNRLARLELEAARDAARQQERALYLSIPPDAKVPTEASRTVLDDFVLTTPKAQQEDIPARALEFLSPTKTNAKGKVVPNPKYIGDTTNVEELRGLQSKLREDARKARAAGDFNAARITDDIADGMTDDIANAVNGEETTRAVEIAVSFSRDLNERFVRNPTVNTLLARGKTGGARVDPALTLETTVGKRGPRAEVENKALLDAVARNTTNRDAILARGEAVPSNLGDVQSMQAHIEGFLIDDWRRAAVVGNRVDVKASQRWLSENQDILRQYPELRKQIDGAQRSQGQLIEAERMFDPRESRAAVFLNATPDTEIRRVIDTADPAAAMTDLVRLVRTDPTGQAERGLKQAFTKYILNESKIAEVLDDLEIVSGSKMTGVLERTPVLQAMRELFTPPEIRRIEQVRKTALLLDAARKTGKSAEGIIGDEPSAIISIIGGVSGAQGGRVLAGMTGGGTVQTPGILASQVRKLLRAGVQDPARRLLSDAISSGDDRLFRALFLPQDDIKNVREVHQRLHAWVLSTLAEQNAIESNDE